MIRCVSVKGWEGRWLLGVSGVCQSRGGRVAGSSVSLVDHMIRCTVSMLHTTISHRLEGQSVCVWWRSKCNG